MQNVKWHAKPLALLVILCMVLVIAPTVSFNLPDLTMTAYAATAGITFADSNFRSAILAANDGNTGTPIDADGDGEISTSEAAAATSWDISGKNIANLDEIEHFTSLTFLNCGNNRLSSLDVSNNPVLTQLHCSGNRLTNIDVSNNPVLGWLTCSNNQLTSIDVSSNTALALLYCNNNQLTNLDVSNNTALTGLHCSNNRLIGLDVSNNAALGLLDCRYNNMASEAKVIGLNRSITTEFYFYPQNGSGPVGGSSSRRSGSSSGGGSGAGTSIVISTTYWIESPEAKEMARIAGEKELDYTRSRRSGSTGIRKNAAAALGTLEYEHDTLLNNDVEVRVYIDQPTKLAADTLISGHVQGKAVNKTKTFFEKFFSNRLQVISMEQKGTWGQSIEIAAKVDLSKINTTNLCFYGYDKATNSYRQILNPNYWVDKSGYVHFTTELAGDIVISDGVLVKK